MRELHPVQKNMIGGWREGCFLSMMKQRVMLKLIIVTMAAYSHCAINMQICQTKRKVYSTAF